MLFEASDPTEYVDTAHLTSPIFSPLPLPLPRSRRRTSTGGAGGAGRRAAQEIAESAGDCTKIGFAFHLFGEGAGTLHLYVRDAKSISMSKAKTDESDESDDIAPLSFLGRPGARPGVLTVYGDLGLTAETKGRSYPLRYQKGSGAALKPLVDGNVYFGRIVGEGSGGTLSMTLHELRGDAEEAYIKLSGGSKTNMFWPLENGPIARGGGWIQVGGRR